ncbi:hypothetical protein [Glycomyces sp. NPDC048151]|uniref:hypothetical protein n=1 Tax=Glycomyces sp. NPDC048151 TaxID=3364002 RepID=UPI0037206971
MARRERPPLDPGVVYGEFVNANGTVFVLRASRSGLRMEIRLHHDEGAQIAVVCNPTSPTERFIRWQGRPLVLEPGGLEAGTQTARVQGGRHRPRVPAELGGDAVNDFADLLSRSVFAIRLPEPVRSAPDATRSGGYRAVVFHEPHSDTADRQGLVGPLRRVTVSCCLCPAAIRLTAFGYGEMARRAEAAGWQYTPGLHLHERAWCPDCRPNAGRAVV